MGTRRGEASPAAGPGPGGGRLPAARAAIGGLVAVLVVALGELPDLAARAGVAGGLLAWVAGGTALLKWAGRFSRRGFAVGLLLIGDMVAAALATWATGGIAAPSLLLIALPVLAGGLLFQCRIGLLLGALAGALCVLLGARTMGPPGPLLARSIAYHGGAFIAVGLGAGLLGRRMAASLSEAAETRRQLEEVRLSTERILENLACGLIAVDADGRPGTVNPAARRLLGLAADDPSGAFQREGRHAPLRDLMRAGLEETAEGSERELELSGPGGRKFPAWVKVAPVTDAAGTLHGLVALFWDLTERKHLEEAARRGERLAAIGELSAGLAHEIRNSLKPITGCIELLGRQGLLDERARPMVEVITREAESLEAFLSQFLALARDKSLKLVQVDLEELIGTEARALSLGAQAQAGAVVIGGEHGLRVMGDPDWLRLVFRNLILNGLEANPGGRVTVNLAAARLDGRPAVRARIADEGPGFGAGGFLEALKPFETGKPAGTGLGLPIALRGVQAHEGRLYLDEREPRGAALVVELPIDGPQRAGGRVAA